MDKQKERARLDEESISDTQTDVTRSQNRQGAVEANESANISDTTGAEWDNQPNRSMNKTGGHQEGQYDKDHTQPMKNENKPGL